MVLELKESASTPTAGGAASEDEHRVSAFKAGTESLDAGYAAIMLNQALLEKGYVDEQDVRACILEIHRRPPFEASTFQRVADVIAQEHDDDFRNKLFELAVDLTAKGDHKSIFRRARAAADREWKERKQDEDGSEKAQSGSRPAYLTVIDALTPEDAHKPEVMKRVVEMTEHLTGAAKISTRRKISKNIGGNLAAVNAEYRKYGPKDKKPAPEAGKRLEFESTGDFYDGVVFCRKVLELQNVKDKRRTYSHLDGAPVRLDFQSNGRAVLTELNSTDLWGDLCEFATFVRADEDGNAIQREKIPEDVAKQIYTQTRWVFKPAPEVIYAPMFLPDGTLMIEPGYNEQHNILLVYNGLEVPKVSADPSKEEMQAALDFLLTDLLGEFPFLDEYTNGTALENGPSRTNALASLVTPFVRRMFDGQTPCFFANKPQPGTGGSMLAKLPGLLADGKVTMLPYHQNDDEMRKVLGAEGRMTTSSCFIFENLKEFNSRALIDAFTLSEFKTRLLGQSQMINITNAFNWGASGNNPTIGPEMGARRLCWMYLNRLMTDSEVRSYKFSRDLESFVCANRGKIVGHILTLISYWRARGSDLASDKRMLNFDPWAATVGGTLEVCGVKGFLEHHVPSDAEMGQNSEEAFISAFEKQWGENTPVSGDDIFKWATGQPIEGKLGDGEKLGIITGHSDGEMRASLNTTLRGLCNRVFGDSRRRVRLRNINGDFKLITMLAEGAFDGG